MIHGIGATSLNLKDVGNIVFPKLWWLSLSNDVSYSDGIVASSSGLRVLDYDAMHVTSRILERTSASTRTE